MKEIGWDIVKWIRLAQDRDKGAGCCKHVMTLRVALMQIIPQLGEKI